MLKTCKYCGRIVPEDHVCSMKPKYNKADNNILKFRNSKEWKHKSLEIKQRDNSFCVYCRIKEGHYTYDDIEVHHIVPLAEDWNKRLDNINLITLCRRHHELAEKGDIDKKILIDLIKNENISPLHNK